MCNLPGSFKKNENSNPYPKHFYWLYWGHFCKLLGGIFHLGRSFESCEYCPQWCIQISVWLMWCGVEFSQATDGSQISRASSSWSRDCVSYTIGSYLKTVINFFLITSTVNKKWFQCWKQSFSAFRKTKKVQQLQQDWMYDMRKDDSNKEFRSGELSQIEKLIVRNNLFKKFEFQHASLHNPIGSFPCPKCRKVYNHPKILEEHLKHYHEE